MKKSLFYYILFLFAAFVVSCNDDTPGTDNNDEPEPPPSKPILKFPKKRDAVSMDHYSMGIGLAYGKI